MAAPAAQLQVFKGGICLGLLRSEPEFGFAYADAYLAAPSAGLLGQLPLQPGWHGGAAVQALFENLLPEGRMRELLQMRAQTTTLFGMLRAVAGDTVGAYVLVPQGRPPGDEHYAPTSWAALRDHLQGQASLPALQDTRISLSGAQYKLSVALWDASAAPWEAAVFLPENTAPSTHIVKPDMRLEGVWQSAANEAFVMQLASRCGLRVAEAFYEPLTQACVVRRFDRVGAAAGRMRRLPQLDMCQLHGLPSTLKYEADGGPSLAQCAAQVRDSSAVPAEDLQQLARWVFFNLFAGNLDAHAKNLSMQQTEAGAWRLAPFYDLMCTRLYPGLAGTLAMRIGGAATPAQVDATALARLAKDLRLSPNLLRRSAQDVATRLLVQLPAQPPGMPLLQPRAQALLQRLRQRLASQTGQYLRRWGWN